jgi:hypothetical protein
MVNTKRSAIWKVNPQHIALFRFYWVISIVDLRKSWGFISSKGDADLEKEWSDLGEDEDQKCNNLERSEPLNQSMNSLSQSPTKDSGKKEDKTKQKFLNFVLNGRNRFLNTFYNLYNSRE